MVCSGGEVTNFLSINSHPFDFLVIMTYQSSERRSKEEFEMERRNRSRSEMPLDDFERFDPSDCALPIGFKPISLKNFLSNGDLIVPIYHQAGSLTEVSPPTTFQMNLRFAGDLRILLLVTDLVSPGNPTTAPIFLVGPTS